MKKRSRTPRRFWVKRGGMVASRELLKTIIAGAFIGYVFIHPLTMAIANFMSDISHFNASPPKWVFYLRYSGHFPSHVTLDPGLRY
jgi:hypothetical protein